MSRSNTIIRTVHWNGNRDVRLVHLDCELPPLQDGEVRLAPAWVGLCGSDVNEWRLGPVSNLDFDNVADHNLSTAFGDLVTNNTDGS